MEFRHLGTSGLKVSALSYGNWLTHGSQVEEEQAAACVRQALEEGITTFDTADVYAHGRAESVLGRALHGVRREGIELCTKVYWPMGQGPNDSGLSRKHIHESIDASLRRLQTDYVDVYQAHRYDHETPLAETMGAFADVVRAGKALYIGVSEWTAGQIRAAAGLAEELRVPLVSNQPQYNMLWRVIEAEVVPASVAAGLGQIVWSPLGQGILTGKYRPGEPPPEGSRAAHEKVGDVLRGRLDVAMLTAVQQLAPVADGLGLSMAQLALAWVLSHDYVSSAIIGATRPEQVTDNVRAVGVSLPDDVLTTVDEILDPYIERDPTKTVSPKTRDFS